MSSTVSCSRCGRQAAALEAPPPLPPELAKTVAANVCADCWSEWVEEEVRVINELRLNFMDPESVEVLHRRLREYLSLPDPAAD